MQGPAAGGDGPSLLSPAGLWQSVHIDDLRRSKDMISDLTALQNLTISQVFSEQPSEGTGELCAGERGTCGPTLGTVWDHRSGDLTLLSIWFWGVTTWLPTCI